MNMHPSSRPVATSPDFVRHFIVSLLAAASVLVSFAATAGPVASVATRTALGANDSVVWAGLDGEQVSSPYAVSSTGGVGVTASASDLWLFQQAGGGGYTGSFSPGDNLLTTFFDNGPLTLNFGKAVRGIGFNIENVNFGDFTGTMEFFDAGDASLGLVTVGGTNNGSDDGSAPFLGGLSNLLDISKVVISVSTVGGGAGLTINEVSLVTTGGGTVPEPSSALLLATALIGLTQFRRRSTSSVA